MRTLRGRVVIRRRLGRRLRRLREQAGLTLVVAAAKLEKDRSTLHRIECGETRADVHLVRSMMDLYDAYEEGLLDLSREAARPAWWRDYQLSNVHYVALETEAAEMHVFGALDVPDLVRTAGYATALQHGRSGSGSGLRSELAARAIRQRRLGDGDNPLQLHVVLDEAALIRAIGGRDVMAEQALYLAQLSEQGRASVQVLPFAAGAHEGVCSFAVLTFCDVDDPDILHVEYVTGALHIERPAEVHAALNCFERLRTRAASPADSRALLRQRAAEGQPPGLMAEREGADR